MPSGLNFSFPVSAFNERPVAVNSIHLNKHVAKSRFELNLLRIFSKSFIINLALKSFSVEYFLFVTATFASAQCSKFE